MAKTAKTKKYIRPIGKKIGTSAAKRKKRSMLPVVAGKNKLAQEKLKTPLKKKQEEFRTIFDSVKAMIFCKDKNNRFINTNRAFEDAMGMAKEDLVNKSLFDIFPRKQAEHYWKDDLEVIASKKPKTGIIEEMETTGGKKFVLTDKMPYFDEHGEVAGVIGFTIDITGQLKTEHDLRETRDYLDNLLNYANAPIIVWYPDCRISKFNNASERMTGYREQEILGKKLDILFPENTRSSSMKRIREAMAGKRWETVEIPILNKNGSVRAVLWNSANVYGPDNLSLVATIAQGQDVTEQKKAEAHREAILKELEEEKRQTEGLLLRIAAEKNLLDVVMENTETHLVYLDRNFNYLKMNPAYCKGCGRSPGELLGKNHFALFPNKEDKKIFESVRATGQPVKFFARPAISQDQAKKTLAYWDWALVPVKNANGEVAGLVFSRIDVTRRIEIEQDLKEHAIELGKVVSDLKNLKLAVENASDIIFIADSGGKVISVNKAVETLLGYLPAEITGRDISNFGESSDGLFYAALLNKIKNDRMNFSGEVTNVRKNGEKVVFELNVAPVLNKKGDVMFFVGIERDRTEAKAIDRAKSEFISLTAHQLRTPLAMVSLSSEMLLNGMAAGQISGDAKQYLEEIFKSAHKMAGLIELFLNVSRIELGRVAIDPVPADVVMVASEVLDTIRLQAKLKKIRVSAAFPQAPLIVSIDRKILHIGLENLLSNAVKYTPEGGHVFLEIKKTGKEVIFNVVDNGNGIAKDELPRLFEKMFRGRNAVETDGLGLGLYITKNTITQAGGKVAVDSNSKKGSVFSISIPLAGMRKKKIDSAQTA